MVYQSALTISLGMTSFSSAEEESTRYLEKKNICSSYMSSGPVALVGSILYKGFYAATLRNNDNYSICSIMICTCTYRSHCHYVYYTTFRKFRTLLKRLCCGVGDNTHAPDLVPCDDKQWTGQVQESGKKSRTTATNKQQTQHVKQQQQQQQQQKNKWYTSANNKITKSKNKTTNTTTITTLKLLRTTTSAHMTATHTGNTCLKHVCSHTKIELLLWNMNESPYFGGLLWVLEFHTNSNICPSFRCYRSMIKKWKSYDNCISV